MVSGYSVLCEIRDLLKEIKKQGDIYNYKMLSEADWERMKQDGLIMDDHKKE